MVGLLIYIAIVLITITVVIFTLLRKSHKDVIKIYHEDLSRKEYITKEINRNRWYLICIICTIMEETTFWKKLVMAIVVGLIIMAIVWVISNITYNKAERLKTRINMM
jgi:hypothetical protein